MTPTSGAVDVLPAVLAAALAGAGVLLALPGRRRPDLGSWGGARPGGREGPGPPVRPVLVVAAVVGPVAGASVWLGGHQVVLLAMALAVVVAVLRLVARGRRTRLAQERADRVLAACEAMASDLAAGQPPLRALARAAEDWDELAPVSSAARMGADVPAALRDVATLPGARRLATVAATWQVAHSTGAGLAAALARAADSIRADRRTTRLVAAELAAAHATARMLAVLPVGVLLLGAGIGGDPVGFLTDSTAGLVCLGAGLGLSMAGLGWLERIADRVLG